MEMDVVFNPIKSTFSVLVTLGILAKVSCQVPVGHKSDSATKFRRLSIGDIQPYICPSTTKSFGVPHNKTWLAYVVFFHNRCIQHSCKNSLYQFGIFTVNCLHKLRAKRLTCQKSHLSPNISVEDVFGCDGCSGLPLSEKIITLFESWTFAKYCIRAVYSSKIFQEYLFDSGFPRLNKIVTQDFTIRKSIIYHFSGHKQLGTNVTFVLFHLSGHCSRYDPGKKHDEFVWVDGQYINSTLYCMTRSQWSVYLGSHFKVKFKPCNLICFGRTSSVIFSHQVIDKNFIQTITDSYHKLTDTSLQYLLFYSLLIAPANPNPIFVSHIFITGHRYQQIQLFLKKIETFLLSPTEVTKYIHHINKTTILYMKYFNCFFSLSYAQSSSIAPINFTFVTIPFKTVYLRGVKYFNVSFVLDDVAAKPFHAATLISTAGEMFATFTFHLFNQSGFHSCLYGGVTFYDGPFYHNTYKLCNKHTHHAGATYTAASSVTLIVTHLGFKGSLNLSYSANPVSCQGIFINSCLRTVHPEYFVLIQKDIYISHKKMGTSVRMFSLFPLDRDDHDKCATFHIGSQYLVADGQLRMTTCTLRFYFVQNTLVNQASLWCKAALFYTKYYAEELGHLVRPFSRWREAEVFMTTNTPANSTVNFDIKAECEEKYVHPTYITRHFGGHVPEELILPKAIFNFWLQIPSKIDSTHQHFKYNADFLFARYTNQFDDILYLREHVLSTHIRLLTVTYQVCGAKASLAQLQLIYISKHILGTVICLKEANRAFIDRNMVLSLSTTGTLSPNLGMLKFSVQICLSIFWFGNLIEWFPINYDFLGLSMCLFHPNSGKLKLEWTSPLTQAMLSTGNGIVHIDLFGKIFLASLELPVELPCSGKCSLTFSWFKWPDSFVSKDIDTGYEDWTKHTSTLLQSNPRYTLASVNLRRFFPINGRDEYTWLDANTMCTKSGNFLPSFLSQADLDSFVEYVGQLGTQLLIPTVFIGLKIKVQKGGDCILNLDQCSLALQTQSFK